MTIKKIEMILDRDGHFIEALKTEKGITLAHRDEENKDCPNSADLHFNRENAWLFLYKIREILGEKVKVRIVEETGKEIEVSLSGDKKEIQIFPASKQWIGMGIAEVRVLVKQLEEKLGEIK